MDASDIWNDRASGGEDPRRLLASLLLKRKGIRLIDYRDRWLERRLQIRLRATGCTAISSYVEYVEKNPDEAERLLDALSINISSFFRNPEVFDLIARTVFASWIEQARTGRRRFFRAWSCACANGEEPYSLSMLWERCVEGRQEGDRLPQLRITASDRDREAIARARAGVYDAPAVRFLPAESRCFLDVPAPGRFRVVSNIRTRVRFACEDVLVESARSRQDLILCRNFLIFLDRRGQEYAIRMLAGTLAVDGYLVLGRAEAVPSSARHLLRAVDADHRIFQKAKG